MELIPERVHRGDCKRSCGGGYPADCIGSPRTAPFGVSSCDSSSGSCCRSSSSMSGRARGRARGKDSVSPDEMYIQMFYRFGGRRGSPDDQMDRRQRPKCLGLLRSNIEAETSLRNSFSQHAAQPTVAATTADTADAINQEDWVHMEIVVCCGFLFLTPDWPCGRCLSKPGMNEGVLDYCRSLCWVDCGCPGRHSPFGPAGRYDDRSGRPCGLEAAVEFFPPLPLHHLSCLRS